MKITIANKVNSTSQFFDKTHREIDNKSIVISLKAGSDTNTIQDKTDNDYNKHNVTSAKLSCTIKRLISDVPYAVIYKLKNYLLLLLLGQPARHPN